MLLAFLCSKEDPEIEAGLGKKNRAACRITGSSPAVILKSYALSTLPDFRQDVHTYIFLAPAPTFTFTDLTLDFHILLERLCEWLTLFPK